MGSTDHSTVEAVDTPSISAVGVLRAVGGPITAVLKMYRHRVASQWFEC